MKKTFGDQMKDDYRNFRDPVKQSFRNMRDNIADGVQDAFAGRREDERPKRKGCLWTIVKWYIIICLAMGVLSECTSEDVASMPAETQVSIPETVLETQSYLYAEDSSASADTVAALEADPVTDTAAAPEDTPVNPLSFLQSQITYAANNGITLCRFPEEEAALGAWLEQIPSNPVYVAPDNIFGADRFKMTVESKDYLYFGQLRDNRPDGYGILLCDPEHSSYLLSYNNRRYVLRYVGQFSDGKLDGFGVLFQESGSGRDFLDRLRPYNPDTGENLDDYLTWGNYASYFGEFSDGVKHGMGNTFNLADFYIADFSIALTQIDLDNPGFSVDVGRYKSDKLNGECQQYIGGYPYYTGECRDDQFDGYGILYYPGTGIPAYEGEFKNDMRHGKGTSYTENGEIIYQGEWKNDDYA